VTSHHRGARHSQLLLLAYAHFREWCTAINAHSS
jgi:hypothetical protein